MRSLLILMLLLAMACEPNPGLPRDAAPIVDMVQGAVMPDMATQILVENFELYESTTALKPIWNTPDMNCVISLVEGQSPTSAKAMHVRPLLQQSKCTVSFTTSIKLTAGATKLTLRLLTKGSTEIQVHLGTATFTTMSSDKMRWVYSDLAFVGLNGPDLKLSFDIFFGASPDTAEWLVDDITYH